MRAFFSLWRFHEDAIIISILSFELLFVSVNLFILHRINGCSIAIDFILKDAILKEGSKSNHLKQTCFI